MLRVFFGLGVALTLAVLPAAAQSQLDPDIFVDDPAAFQEAQAAEPQLTPSDAAGIAQDAVPGSRVLKVKLLPNGDYAVTLKVKGSVMRVVVSGVDGSIL